MAESRQGMELSNLFGGTRFWLSLQVPQRNRFKQMIEEHGGTVVLHEKHANVMLVDHTKRNVPSGTYSYKYVENSVRNGKLENLESHRAGSSAPRPVGASHIARKGTRSEYTLADDQILFDWLYRYEQEEGAPISGNKIYQQLAERFPQHTYQSWRARYLKNLRGKPRPGKGEPRSHEEVLSLSQVSPSTATESEPQLQLKPKPARIPAAARQDQVSQTARSSSNGSGGSKLARETDGERQPQPQTTTAAEPLSRPKPQARPKPQTEPNPMAAPNTMARPHQSHTSGVDSKHQANESYRKSSSVSNHSTTSHHSHPGSPSFNRRGSASTAAKGTFIETPEAIATLVHNLSATPPTWHKSAAHGPRSPTTGLLSFKSPTKKKPQEFATAADVFRFWKPPENLSNQLIDFDPSEFALPLPPPSAEQSPEPSSDEDVEMGGTEEESYPDVDSWIDAQVQRGAEEATVLEALQCTSMLTEYAERVLKHYADGNGMPTDMQGAWTAEDDKALEGTDSRVMEKLYEKHGQDLVNYRLEYLNMARQE